MIDWHLTIPGVELRSLNRDLRGTSMGARMAAASRAKSQRTGATTMCWAKFGAPPAPPLTITITRVAPAELDTDNLAASAKHVRDGVSDWLGINDKDKRLQWRYEQEKQGKGVYGVKIRVQTWQQTFAEYLLGHKQYQSLHNTCLKLAAVWMNCVNHNHEVELPTPAMISAKKKWERLATKRDRLMEDLRAEWKTQNAMRV